MIFSLEYLLLKLKNRYDILNLGLKICLRLDLDIEYILSCPFLFIAYGGLLDGNERGLVKEAKY